MDVCMKYRRQTTAEAECRSCSCDPRQCRAECAPTLPARVVPALARAICSPSLQRERMIKTHVQCLFFCDMRIMWMVLKGRQRCLYPCVLDCKLLDSFSMITFVVLTV